MERPFKHRVMLVGGIAAYAACFQWIYVHYLYPEFGYFGYDYNAPSTSYLLLAWSLIVLSSLWMPMELKRPSQLAYWVLYITVFIPSMFVPLFAGLDSPAEIGMLMVTMFAGFAIVGSTYLLPLFQLRPSSISAPLFWKGVGCLALILMIWLALVFRDHMQIVSFQDVYDLRDAANDVQEGSQVNYAFMLLTGAINPFLMGCGLFSRRRFWFLAGALGQVLVYSVGGTKGSVLSIPLVCCLYVLFKIGRTPFALKVTFASVGLAFCMSLSYVLAGYEPGPLHSMMLFVVLMRTLSINGLVTAQYFDFFQHNPLTYFSHIKVINWFVHYPYRYPIGQEIGLAYAGTTGLDATAHFWATDGIGGLGLPGILFISILCAFVFRVLDSAAQRHDPRLAALLITYAAYNISNISLFTSLLSGGLMLLLLLLYLMPQEACVTSAGEAELRMVTASRAS